MNAMGNIKVLTKTGINMKVFWASIEYKYNGNPMKGDLYMCLLRLILKQMRMRE